MLGQPQRERKCVAAVWCGHSLHVNVLVVEEDEEVGDEVGEVGAGKDEGPASASAPWDRCAESCWAGVVSWSLKLSGDGLGTATTDDEDASFCPLLPLPLRCFLDLRLSNIVRMK